MMRGVGFLWALVAALALTGCAGYHLGPTNGEVAGAHSVQIDPFLNKTLEPRVSEYVISTLRKNLQQDGTYRIDTHDDGDIVVSGVIVAFQRNELSVQPTDVITALDYEIIITAQVKAVDRRTSKLLFDRLVKGRTSLRVGNDLTSAERQAIPQAADDLAKKVATLLVEGTW
ncbi:MAG: hypothetical protein JWR26_4182 [Pedosphaera sp.]|nr:hypothetical protein [Pedosphaera sp.]